MYGNQNIMLKKIVKAMNFMQLGYFLLGCLANFTICFDVIAYASEMTSTGLSGMLSPSIGNLSHLRTL